MSHSSSALQGALHSATLVSVNIVRCVSNGAVLALALVVTSGFETLAMLAPEIILNAALSGIIGLGLGDTLYVYRLKSIGLSTAVPLAATYHPFQSIVAFLLGEPVYLPAIVGTMVILLGIWLLGRRKNGEGLTESRALFRSVVAGPVTAVLWSLSVTLMDVVVSRFGAEGIDANFATVALG